MNQREAQAAESRQKLIDSAQALFAEKGYKGASVREINRNVGLADGLLYHYFPGGKKDLFRIVVENNIKQIIDDFSEHTMIDTYLTMPLVDMLEAVYVNFTKIISSHMDVIRILFRESEVRDIIGKEDVYKLMSANAPWFKNLLERKYEQGEIRKMDFESAAITMEALLLNHVMAVAVGLEAGMLGDQAVRSRITSYFADIWKKSEH